MKEDGDWCLPFFDLHKKRDNKKEKLVFRTWSSYIWNPVMQLNFLNRLKACIWWTYVIVVYGLLLLRFSESVTLPQIRFDTLLHEPCSMPITCNQNSKNSYHIKPISYSSTTSKLLIIMCTKAIIYDYLICLTKILSPPNPIISPSFLSHPLLHPPTYRTTPFHVVMERIMNL